MAIHNDDVTLIRDIIKERDNTQDKELYVNICHLWNVFFEVQENQKSSNNDNQSAGYSHCIKNEENLGKIIRYLEKHDKLSLNLTELCLLSAAACVHDVGKSRVFKEDHEKVAMQDILENPKKYQLTAPFCRILSIIVGAHNSDEIFEETEEKDVIGSVEVNPRLLSALFRLADVLHTDNTRVSHITVGDETEESDKTRFRRLVHGWYINNNGYIELRAQPEKVEDRNIINKGVQMMNDQIKNVAPYLHAEGCPYKIICTTDDRLLKKK